MLLAQLYRLWAAARASDLVKLVAHHKLSPLGEEGSQASAELGLLAAGLLEQAQAKKCDGAVLALDQSKAYDRVPWTSWRSSCVIAESIPLLGGRCVYGQECSSH